MNSNYSLLISKRDDCKRTRRWKLLSRQRIESTYEINTFKLGRRLTAIEKQNIHRQVENEYLMKMEEWDLLPWWKKLFKTMME